MSQLTNCQRQRMVVHDLMDHTVESCEIMIRPRDKVAEPVGVAAEAEVGCDGGGGAGEEDDALEPVGDFAGAGADAAPVVGALLEEVAVPGSLAPHVISFRS